MHRKVLRSASETRATPLHNLQSIVKGGLHRTAAMPSIMNEGDGTSDPPTYLTNHTRPRIAMSCLGMLLCLEVTYDFD